MTIVERRRERILTAVRELSAELGRGLKQLEVSDRAGESRWRVRQELAVLSEQGLVRAPAGRLSAIEPIYPTKGEAS